MFYIFLSLDFKLIDSRETTQDKNMSKSRIPRVVYHPVYNLYSDSISTLLLTIGSSRYTIDSFMCQNEIAPSAMQSACPALTEGGQHRGTSLIRNRHPAGPYRRPMPRALGVSWGDGRFLTSELPLYGSVSQSGPDGPGAHLTRQMSPLSLSHIVF